MMLFQEVEKNLNNRTVMPMRAPSLEPMNQALSRFDFDWPENLQQIILVAGTNGKGTVCKALESLLLAAGKSVGMYTSPHLMEINERIRVNGKNISDLDFALSFTLLESRVKDLGLSHFEMLTLMAIWNFCAQESKNKVDWVVLEVGMGGTWDATNAIPHGTSVITSIGHDHQHILGNSITEIAANKFGIIHEDSLVVCGQMPAEVKLKENWIKTSESAYLVEGDSLPNFTISSKYGKFRSKLPGKRAAQNLVLALDCFAALGFSPVHYTSCLEQMEWAGRMSALQISDSHKLESKCPIYFSGDHNVEGVDSLIELLQHYRWERLHLIVAVGAHKNVDEILEKLIQIPRVKLYLTQSSFMALELAQYGDWLNRCEAMDVSPSTLLEKVASKSNKKDLILVTGSLYLVGDLMKRFAR